MSVKVRVCFSFNLLLSSEKTRSAAPDDGMTRERSCAASQYTFNKYLQTKDYIRHRQADQAVFAGAPVCALRRDVNVMMMCWCQLVVMLTDDGRTMSRLMRCSDDSS